MPNSVDVFVCVTCKDVQEPVGRLFFEQLQQAVTERDHESRPKLHPVECMAVCKRPCTVAVSAADKWTYVIGDLASLSDAKELLAYVDSYAASEAGTPSLKERPPAIRKGTVARIPANPKS